MTENGKIAATVAVVVGCIVVSRYLPRGPYITDPPYVTVPPTITMEQAIIIAEEVSAAIYDNSTFWAFPGFGSAIEDEQRVVDAMTQDVIMNDADVLLVADAYGIRSRMFSVALTLPQAIRYYLSTGQVDRINSAWRTRTINIQF